MPPEGLQRQPHVPFPSSPSNIFSSCVRRSAFSLSEQNSQLVASDIRIFAVHFTRSLGRRSQCCSSGSRTPTSSKSFPSFCSTSHSVLTFIFRWLPLDRTQIAQHQPSHLHDRKKDGRRQSICPICAFYKAGKASSEVPWQNAPCVSLARTLVPSSSASSYLCGFPTFLVEGSKVTQGCVSPP